MKTRRKGSVGQGVFLILFGLSFLAAYLFCLLSDKSSLRSEPEYIPFVTIAFVLPTIVFSFLGVDDLRWGITTKKVIKHGRKGTCVIKEFRTAYRKSGVFMDVTYKDDNGNTQEYSAHIDDKALNALHVGITLECLIYGKDCYIDVQELKVIDKDLAETEEKPLI